MEKNGFIREKTGENISYKNFNEFYTPLILLEKHFEDESLLLGLLQVELHTALLINIAIPLYFLLSQTNEAV